MTDEQIHDKVPTWIDDDEPDKVQWHYGRQELHRDIDRVIEAVSSRNCGNCKYGTKSVCSLIDIPLIDMKYGLSCSFWRPNE